MKEIVGFAPVSALENRQLSRLNYGLSVVLPAFNEEAVIAETIQIAVDALTPLVQDFEVIVVNDGSSDSTGAIVEILTTIDSRVHLINHVKNQGCGTALVSGFEAAKKDMVFYMDSDGQFDIHDLAQFLLRIEDFDAIFGYRIGRQDSWIRKMNAWLWNQIVRFVFGIQICDIDCAFKLYRAEFFRTHKLEARGAMLLTEIVYKFVRDGYTYTQVGVRHYPRKGGKGTGAKLSVILRTFHEMFFYARKWRQEENDILLNS